jgi:glycosyltransferase involved in cell wall biosynthesis
MNKRLIQCVIVLYKQSPRDSQALNTLLRICAEDRTIATQIEILVQDNSPESHEVAVKFLEIDSAIRLEYHHTPHNPGLAHAYNSALSRASSRDLEWLLLLDQDTCLTKQFLAELFIALHQDYFERPCAFVPQLVQDDLVLSPQFVGKVLYHRMDRSFSGLALKPVVAFNSAACISVEDLIGIGGFPEEFWLDYLDHIVFHRLQQERGRVFVLNSQLEHSLSLVDIELNVSNERYGNILRAEWLFVRKSGWGGGPTVHRLRLLKRACSHSIKLGNKSYALQTLRSVLS